MRKRKDIRLLLNQEEVQIILIALEYHLRYLKQLYKMVPIFEITEEEQKEREVTPKIKNYVKRKFFDYCIKKEYKDNETY